MSKSGKRYSANFKAKVVLELLEGELMKAVRKYNTYRPHFNLKGLTPMQYIERSLLELAS